MSSLFDEIWYIILGTQISGSRSMSYFLHFEKAGKTPKKRNGGKNTKPYFKRIKEERRELLQIILTDVISVCTHTHKRYTPWRAKVSCE